MTWQQLGLWTFVVTALGTLGVLGFDWWLDLNGYTMITTYCRRYPPLAWAILLVLQFGYTGLSIHLMRPVVIDRDTISRVNIP